MAGYTDIASVRLLAEPINRQTATVDDGLDDVIQAFIDERSRVDIDGRLGTQFAVPFAGALGPPNTYDPTVVFIVKRMAASDTLAYAQAQTQKKGEGTLAASFLDEANAKIEMILNGSLDLTVARTTAEPSEPDSIVLPALDDEHVPFFLPDADGNDPLETFGTM